MDSSELNGTASEYPAATYPFFPEGIEQVSKLYRRMPQD